MKSLSQAVLLLLNDRAQLINPVAKSMFGEASHDRPPILELSSLLHPAVRNREIDRLTALRKGLISLQQNRRVKLLRLDGVEMEAEVTELLIENDKESSIYWLVNDLTQGEKMQVQLEDANKQLKQLSQRLIEVQEAERRQIARDLHDDIGQQLTGLKLHLYRLHGKLQCPMAAKTTSALIAGTDQALTKVRSLSLALHPLQLETLGLEQALRWHLANFLEATHTVWELHRQGTLDELPLESAIAAFRIVQEAVNNVAKHAQASHLLVTLVRDEKSLKLEILDDGNGFDARSIAQEANSLGLTSMRERTASLEGQLFINSLEGVGTRISVQLPIVKCHEKSGEVNETASCAS